MQQSGVLGEAGHDQIEPPFFMDVAELVGIIEDLEQRVTETRLVGG